jgi:hypothetical protein
LSVYSTGPVDDLEGSAILCLWRWRSRRRIFTILLGGSELPPCDRLNPIKEFTHLSDSLRRLADPLMSVREQLFRLRRGSNEGPSRHRGQPRQSQLHPPGNKKEQVEANGRAYDQQGDGQIRPSGYAVGPRFLRLRGTPQSPSPKRAAARVEPRPAQGERVRREGARAPGESGPRGSEPVLRTRLLGPLCGGPISPSHPDLRSVRRGASASPPARVAKTTLSRILRLAK